MVVALAVIPGPTLSIWIAALCALGAADPLDHTYDVEQERLFGALFSFFVIHFLGR
jgi:hypothetical protein